MRIAWLSVECRGENGVGIVAQTDAGERMLFDNVNRFVPYGESTAC